MSGRHDIRRRGEYGTASFNPLFFFGLASIWVRLSRSLTQLSKEPSAKPIMSAATQAIPMRCHAGAFIWVIEYIVAKVGGIIAAQKQTLAIRNSVR
jgi:hypothetical protein